MTALCGSRFGWLAAGLLGVLAPAAAQGQASPSAHTSGVRYDAARRVVGTIAPDPDGAGPLKYLAVRNSYDAAGRLWRVETGELAAWQSEQVAPAGWPNYSVSKRVEYEYDAQDRKTVERVYDVTTGAPVSVTQYSYEGLGRVQCTAVRMNPAAFGALPASACTLGTQGAQGPDRITRNVYDATDQLVQVRKAVGTSLEQAYATYEYSPNGKQRTLIDAAGNRTEMSYDGQDRQSRWTFPSASAVWSYNPSSVSTALASAGAANASDYEEYAYDKAGNRLSLRKRDGRPIAYSYDALNRVVTKTYPQGGARPVYYTYDLRGLQTAARFDSNWGSEAVTSAWSGFGEQMSTTTTMGSVSRTLTFPFDANGNRTMVTFPDGASLTYNYDGMNRLSWMQQPSNLALSYATYNTAGDIGKRFNFFNHGYDGAGRLTSMSMTIGVPYDVTLGLGYNAAGQIVQRTRSNDVYAHTGYVSVNRHYQPNGLNQYFYAAGNTFSYDANGNLISDGNDAYGYDIENRLTSKSGSVWLQYDPLGRLWRVGTTTGSTYSSTEFLYDGDRLVAEYGNVGNLLRRYAHGPGADELLYWYEGAGTATSSLRALLTDHLGSVIWVLDNTGGSVGVNTYDEYGIPGQANVGRFQYTGQAWLPEVGMYYYKARMYSPTLGRFMQTDPIGYDDQVNLYAYVANDPVNNTDPTGQWIDTVVDIALITADVADIASNGANQTNLVSLGANIVGAVLPGVTGLGTATRAVSAARSANRGSDVARTSTLRPGPNARESIPAQPGRPTAAQQREINRIGNRDGCHTCGSRDSGRRSGNWTGDHQPPNGRNSSGQAQRFHPHCANCSARQGAEVRNANRGTPPPAEPRLPRRRPED